MPMIRFFSLLLLLLTSLLAFSQNREKVFYDVEEALEQPQNVTRFFLDCSAGDDSLFFASIKQFSNLQSLTIVGYEKRSFPASLFSLGSLVSMSVSECPSLDFNLFFQSLQNVKTLQQINIDECNVKTIPSSVHGIPLLSKLVITNCEQFDLENSIEILSGCNQLKYLGLPVNDLCEIPAGIGSLNQIEILDISNNALFDLPESMALMNGLNTLYTTSNLFVSPVDAISKAGVLQIKYLSVDSTLSELEIEKLRMLFPDTRIGFSSPGDSIFLDPTENSQPVYGEFISTNGAVQILSEAYLHYARLFMNPSGFDSLLFSERYADPRYAYTGAMAAQQFYSWNSLLLYQWKPVNKELPKGSICFNFYKESGASYSQDIISFYRELSAFRGMYWVLTEDSLSKKEFRRNFMKRNKAARYPGAGWNDIRIYYDDVRKEFSLEFKNAFGFMRISAYPLFENLKNPALSREEYLKRFLRYQKLLDTKRKRFDTKLIKSLQSYRRTNVRLRESQWKSFYDVYLSEEEKKMSKEEWLLYYDKVIADELSAFKAAPVTEQLLRRYLVLNGFIPAPAMSLMGYDSASVITLADFVDPVGNKMAVSSFCMINRLQKVFFGAGGTLGLEPQTLLSGPSSEIIMIVFLRNGDIGVLSNEEYRKMNCGSNEVQLLQINIFNGKLFSFSQLASEIGI